MVQYVFARAILGQKRWFAWPSLAILLRWLNLELCYNIAGVFVVFFSRLFLLLFHIYIYTCKLQGWLFCIFGTLFHDTTCFQYPRMSRTYSSFKKPSNSSPKSVPQYVCDINISNMVILNIQPRNTKKTLRFLCSTIFSRWVFRNFTKAIFYVKALQRRWPAWRPWSWLVGLPSWHILPANFEVDKSKGVVMVVVVQWIEQTLDFLERDGETSEIPVFFSLFLCLFVCLFVFLFFGSNSVNMSRTGYIYIYFYI